MAWKNLLGPDVQPLCHSFILSAGGHGNDEHQAIFQRCIIMIMPLPLGISLLNHNHFNVCFKTWLSHWTSGCGCILLHATWSYWTVWTGGISQPPFGYGKILLPPLFCFSSSQDWDVLLGSFVGRAPCAIPGVQSLFHPLHPSTLSGIDVPLYFWEACSHDFPMMW